MIEIVEGLWVSPEHVALIKAVGDNLCVLYTIGQSALDGHVLEYPASEVAEAINDALCDCGEEEIEENE